MKTLALLLLILSLFSCSNNKQVNIASFNVAYPYVGDVDTTWQSRVPLVKSFLEQESFDIIGMQEVSSNQLVDLQELMPDYDYVGTNGKNRLEPSYHCAIFFKRSKFILLAKSRFWLSETPGVQGSLNWDATFPGIVTWVKLKNKRTGHIFFVFNTRFCDESELAREKSSILVLKTINEIAGSAPVVLTGSLNMGKNSKPYNTLTSNWNRYSSLIDSEIVARKRVNSNSTANTPPGGLTHEDKTNFILVNSNFSVGTFKIHHGNDYNGLVPGHYPVSVILDFLFEKRPHPGTASDVPWNDSILNTR